jgi:hypothetical protein
VVDLTQARPAVVATAGRQRSPVKRIYRGPVDGEEGDVNRRGRFPLTLEPEEWLPSRPSPTAPGISITTPIPSGARATS